MIDIEFNFEKNKSSNPDSFLSDLQEVDVLWRLTKNDGTKSFYILRFDKDEEEISLYDLNADFLERNNQLCHSDCFLGFMFFIVYENPPKNERQMRKKLAVQLSKERLQALANSNQIFLEKVSYIRVSPVERQNYTQAIHWDMKYVEDRYCEDDDLIEMLFNCSDVYEVTNQLRVRDDLAA